MGKFSEYKIRLKSMPQGTQEFEYHLGKQFFVNMESADIHDADLTVHLTVVHKADIYDMTFVITGTVTLLCDRCLDDLIYPIDARYHVTVKYGEAYNDESDDLLVIPESDSDLNVAYMLYDTVSLSIPIKHVHPHGKCNRAMSQLLKKHRATTPADEDAELEEELIDEMDNMVMEDEGDSQPTDPRWNELKKQTDNNK